MEKDDLALLKKQSKKLSSKKEVAFVFYFDKRSRADQTKGNQLFIVDGATFKDGDVRRTVNAAKKSGAKVVVGTADLSSDKKARFTVKKLAHATNLGRGLKPIGTRVPPLQLSRVIIRLEGSEEALSEDALGVDESEVIEEDEVLSVDSIDSREELAELVSEGGPTGQAAAVKLRGQIEQRIEEQIKKKLSESIPWTPELGLALRQLLDQVPAADFSDWSQVLVSVRAAMMDGPIAALQDSAPLSDGDLQSLVVTGNDQEREDAAATLRDRLARRVAAAFRTRAAGIGEVLTEEAALAMARLATRDLLATDLVDLESTAGELTATLVARQIALSEALAEEAIEDFAEPETLPETPAYLSEPLDVVRARLAKLATDATAVDDEAPAAYRKRLKIAEYLASTLADDELEPPRSGVDYLIERIRDALVEEELPDTTPIQIQQDIFALPKASRSLKRLLEKAHGLLQLDEEQVLLKEHRDDAYATVKSLESELAKADEAIKPYVGLYLRNLNTHFFTATRREKTGSVSSFFKSMVGSDVQDHTLLELPDGRQLELWNKTSPTTGEEVDLGKGGFGYGRFGVMHDPSSGTSQTVFVKKMRHSKQDVDPANPFIAEQIKNTDRLELKAFLKEVAVMKRLSGKPNIVTVYDGIVSKGKDGKEKMYLMMEMLPGGDVEGLLKKQESRGALGIEARKLIVKQALTGLKAVHDEGIIHRDIKPENLMMTADGTVKLVDFGTAALTDEKGRVVSPDSTGTPGFRPPTIDYGGDITRKPPVYVYSKANDIFAMKVTVEKLIKPEDLADNPDLTAFMAAFGDDGVTCDDLLAMAAMTGIDEALASEQRTSFTTAG